MRPDPFPHYTGGTSALQSKQINITAVNDAPVIGSIGPAVTYTEGGPRALAVGFASSSTSPSTTPRSITVRLTDGLGGTSALQSKLVNVIDL
jgi:hypothetical protein